jgi:shikimate dehydrogenase
MRAADLAARVASAFPAVAVHAGAPDPAGFDIAVNATSSGLKPDDPLPMRVESLTPGMIVVDIIMEPAETRLLAEAKARGCITQPGWPMMECQMEGFSNFLDAERKMRHG